MTLDVIVIGGGHAGIEAASAAARMGASVALISSDLNAIGRLSCNPAIGGMAKGQLVREIDALGGEMGRLADRSGIQFKMLGRSKGPAMWSPRSQNDKDLYPRFARERLSEIEGLTLIEGTVADILMQEGGVSGVVLGSGQHIACRTVVLCAGTFLCGRMHVGESMTHGGRVGEVSSEGLSGSLRQVGFKTGRLKTGTPPRIAADSIDFSSCGIDAGDENPRPFSFRTDVVNNQVVCFTTSTTAATHDVLRTGFDRSPMFTGRITGSGPRYCPSIEDKIFRFADRDSHQIFLEPETLNGESIYVNGFSTSLPAEIQEAALRTVPGLERCRILRNGYAVEYDFFPPYQLTLGLESKLVSGLFFAGQVNGTSGYEEAAAQGLVAGINAASKIQGLEPFVMDRSQSYIGVLIDDLVNLVVDEPYRMFTSRAEYRLLLRQDNADLRLTSLGYRFGLIDSEYYEQVCRKEQMIAVGREFLKQTGITEITTSADEHVKIWQWMKRPGNSLHELLSQMSQQPAWTSPAAVEQLEIEARYGGYIDRQMMEVENFRSREDARIPDSIDYARIKSLSSEGREKLAAIRPESLGQASRIAGVSRSDIAVLMLYLR